MVRFQTHHIAAAEHVPPEGRCPLHLSSCISNSKVLQSKLSWGVERTANQCYARHHTGDTKAETTRRRCNVYSRHVRCVIEEANIVGISAEMSAKRENKVGGSFKRNFRAWSILTPATACMHRQLSIVKAAPSFRAMNKQQSNKAVTGVSWRYGRR